ncbi:MAG TPA: hypothetical protein VKU01_20280 [Bryobacteraceae bacterium]|nr:hypothetical protein [Bryobacteraceae bacterium]
MLRISYSNTAEGQRWVLSGSLAGPWVDELRCCWHNMRQHARSVKNFVDLKDVTFIDEAGEGLLLEMRGAGAEFVAAGVDHKHLLANLNQNGARPLRRRMEHLRAACGDAPGKSEGGRK